MHAVTMKWITCCAVGGALAATYIISNTLGSTAGESADYAELQAAALPVGMDRVTLAVAGMDCAGCAISTEAALRALPGVQSAEVTYVEADMSGSALVVFDPSKVKVDQMVAAVDDVGFAASPVPSTVRNRQGLGRIL